MKIKFKANRDFGIVDVLVPLWIIVACVAKSDFLVNVGLTIAIVFAVRAIVEVNDANN